MIKKKMSVSLLLFAFIGFTSAYINEGYGGYPMMGRYSSGGMFFGWIVGLLVIAVLVLLIIWLYKQIRNKK